MERDVRQNTNIILQMIEDGMLVDLPCNIGDKVYYVYDNKVFSFVVAAINIRVDSFTILYELLDITGCHLRICNNNFTIYKTYEQAEEKLKELKGEIK